MADLKTTNIYGDAYINNKVGIATNAPATRLQIGQLSPTAATEGIQFGDDTSARIYRDSAGIIKVAGGFQAATYVQAGNYLQTVGNLIYPASQTATQRLEVGNASGNAWIDGLTIAQGGNVTVYNNLTVNNAATVTNDLTVNGNTYLGNAGGDTVFVNDIIRIGATDSGDASLFFGEGSVAGSDYGARWYWDSGYTFTWYTRNNGTDTALFDYVTNDTTYLNWRRHFHMQNKEINYAAQIHFNAGTRFAGQDTNYLVFRSDSTSVGGIRVQDGGITTKGYIGYWDSSGGGILNNTGNWALRYNFGNTSSGGTLFGAWVVDGNISATNLSGTNTGDQSIGNGTITIAAGTGVSVGATNTFTTNQSGATTVTVTNSGVTSNVAGTGISVSGATGAVTVTNTGVTSVSAGTGIGTSASTGAVTITNSGVTSLAGTTNRVTVSAATGGITLNLPQDIHTGASPTFAGLSLTSVSTTGATITNLTGAYQNTTVYNNTNTLSTTPTRGIRAPASSIQFTDSYAIAPFYTYRSTSDWPVPYGIGWGTGGESSGIFQRYASNGSSFGDMIFYTGNDGSGAFSFRRHTWEGTSQLAAGSGELNTELFRVDWSGNLTMLGTLNGSANSATLYPNNGPYGSWKIGGTRGGWYGIEFESGTILMANSSESGFYRNGVGWQMWWSGGTGYVQKGASGGGTQATILESSNYTSYTPGLGTNNTLTGINTINNTSNTVINTLSGNLGLTMFQATAGTDAYMTFHIGSDYAAYFGLGGAENDLVYGGWSAGNNRHRILHSGNATYAWNMNQYVRTTDNPTFGTVTAALSGNASTATGQQSGVHFTLNTGGAGYGLVGQYNPDTHQAIFAMGTGYTLAAGGTLANFYGVSWSYDYSGRQLNTGYNLQHCLAIANAGTVYTVIGLGIWTNGLIRANGAISSGGTITATTFSGAGTSLTGTAASLSIGGNAATAGGLSVHGGTNNEANKIVRTDGNGYINAGWINTPSGDMPDTQSINRIYCSDDQYIRYKGVADFKQQIGLTYKNATPRSANTTDPNYWTGVMGWASTDFNTMITWGSGFIDSWASPGNSPGAGFGHFVGLQSLHYTNGDTDGTDNYGYQLVAGGGVNSPLFLRVNWGSAGSWKTMLDSLNFNSYSPSLTGNGASGTWSINVTGNAGGSSTSCSGNAATATALTSMNISQFTNNSGYLTSVTNISGNAATATTATNVGVGSGNTSAAWYPVVWHSGNTLFSSGVQIYAGNNYVQATYFNSSDNDETGITRFVIKNGDGYHRSATTTSAADIIRGVASGTWSITAATANALTTGNTYQVANIGIGVSPSNRLHINGDGVNPTIRIDNTVFGTGSSNSRVFFGWLPISINVFGTVTTKYIQLYNSF
jgi:hypothetical protein